MDSSELTADQCRAIQARVREQQPYFDKLLARMNSQGLPPNDPLPNRTNCRAAVAENGNRSTAGSATGAGLLGSSS